MNLKKATLGQLLYLSRYSEWRYEAILEIDNRLGEYRNELKTTF